MDVINYFAYKHIGVDDQHPPDLAPALQEVCRERFRRIDRFTQLSIIGATQCLDQAVDNTRTGLYIGSRYGPLETTINVQKDMFLAHQLPKPAQFINTLSNSAGYYVAKNLGLSGKNSFVSRKSASTEAVIQLVELDFLSGLIDHALVGFVEELGHPAELHRQRLGLKDRKHLSEVSYWLLLGNSQSKKQGECSIFASDTHSCEQQLQAWLEKTNLAGSCSSIFFHSEGTKTPTFLTPYIYRKKELPQDYHPAKTAEALISFLDDISQVGIFLSIFGDTCGRFHTIALEKTL